MPKSPNIHGTLTKRDPRTLPQVRRPEGKASNVSLPAAAAVALMRMGMSDYAEIATAVGLSVRDVERIDRADDHAIRRLGAEGIPLGEYFKLHRVIRCPKCNASIRVVPCVACACRSFPTQQ